MPSHKGPSSFELRDHLKRMRHRRRGSDDQIGGSQATHATSCLRTEPAGFQNQLLKLCPSGEPHLPPPG